MIGVLAPPLRPLHPPPPRLVVHPVIPWLRQMTTIDTAVMDIVVTSVEPRGRKVHPSIDDSMVSTCIQIISLPVCTASIIEMGQGLFGR